MRSRPHPAYCRGLPLDPISPGEPPGPHGRSIISPDIRQICEPRSRMPECKPFGSGADGRASIFISRGQAVARGASRRALHSGLVLRKGRWRNLQGPKIFPKERLTLSGGLLGYGPNRRKDHTATGFCDENNRKFHGVGPASSAGGVNWGWTSIWAGRRNRLPSRQDFSPNTRRGWFRVRGRDYSGWGFRAGSAGTV